MEWHECQTLKALKSKSHHFRFFNVYFPYAGSKTRGRKLALSSIVHKHVQSNRACNIIMFSFKRSFGIPFFSILMIFYFVINI
jgi:hypothetical protein